MLFDVHGSVHLGNAYVRLKVQLDVLGFKCILYSSLFFALHVSVAIYTHPQEHKHAMTITHTYGCTLQFVLLRMGANITGNM
jgi:hypothetical protein